MLSALFLPRLFSGLVEVIPVSGASLDGPSLVQPRSGNFTQLGYMIISYFTTLSISVIGSRDDIQRHFLRALIWTSLALIVSGLADLVCYRLGLSALLAPFRTAGYELLTDVEAAGAKRVVGLTPEASSYGTLCLQMTAALLLLRPLFRAGWERLVANLALIGVAGMALLSTSATAFAGGGVLAVVYLIDLAGRAIRPGGPGGKSVGFEFAVLAVSLVLALAAIGLAPKLVAPLFDMLNKIVFEKSATFSYYQRNLWNQIGWAAFLDSGGLGVGLGSVRTSNWIYSILASTGIFGGAMIFGFLLQKIATPTRGATPEVASFRKGLRLWLLPALIMSTLGGTIPDIGVMMSIALGMLSTAAPSSDMSAAAARSSQRDAVEGRKQRYEPRSSRPDYV